MADRYVNPLTVADLIELLSQEDPEAVVVAPEDEYDGRGKPIEVYDISRAVLYRFPGRRLLERTPWIMESAGRSCSECGREEQMSRKGERVPVVVIAGSSIIPLRGDDK